MDDKLRKYLTDIHKSILQIESFLGEKKNFKRFQRNLMLQSAVERQIEIIGEAMNLALQLDETLSITDARKIVNTRNKLIHGYATVDIILIWDITSNKLPILKKEIETLLSE